MNEANQKRRVWWTAFILGLIAVGIYIGFFIVMGNYGAG